MRRALTSVITTTAALLAVGCTSSSTRHAVPPIPLRLGFVATITQAPALIGARAGILTADLAAAHTRVLLVPFSTPAAETAALDSRKLDAAYTDPGTLLQNLTTHGAPAIAVISGAATGGAQLIVTRAISTPAQLAGKTLTAGTPGTAPDLEFRAWLTARHLTIGQGHGQVTISPMTPAAALTAFRNHAIAGAWEPAPYDTQLIQAGGRSLTPAPRPGSPAAQNAAATTILVTTRSYLQAHSAAVTALIKAQIQINDYIHHDPLAAEIAANAELAALTGHPLPGSLLTSAFQQITFTDNPATASLAADAAADAAAGLITGTPNLAASYDLAPLNLLLRLTGEPLVSS